MAVITAMVILPRDTAIPADAVTNTWHFNTNDTETDFTVATNIKTRLQGFYDTAHGTNAVSSYLSKALDPANGRLKLYKQSDAPPRVPFSDVSFALVGVGTGDPMVSEAAICMSFHAAYTSGVNRARRRGRIFLGPLAVNTIAFLNNEPVVDATCRTDITASAEWLIAQDTAALKWAVFSQADNTGHAPIVGGWVDNAYDTQRRRGRAATARTNILTGQVPTHTKQLASGWKTSSGTATVLLYTCPAGKRTIIKRITAAGIVTGVDVSFYCTTTSGAVVNWIFTHNALTGTDDHETWCVLHPGDELSLAITVPSGGFASWLVSGTELFIG